MIKFLKLKRYINNKKIKIRYLDFDNIEQDILSFKSMYNFDVPEYNIKKKVNVSFHKHLIYKLSKDDEIKKIINESHHSLDYEIKKNFKKI